tara:strand:- start:16741 stop:17673 length:933 start_codon:yes stop_codon:yes gene_type:complete
MTKKKIRSFIVIFFLIFIASEVRAAINNSVIIAVGNLPITYLDLVKEMKIISIISNNKIDNSNREQIKGIAVKTLVKRKIKEIEINKYNIKDYNKNDLEKLIIKTSANIGTDKEGLKDIMRINNLSFEEITKRFQVDLKWNSLIFQLYKNKVSLNMSEIENKINAALDNMETSRLVLLSEIEINRPKENDEIVVNKVIENIKIEGFKKTAKKFSISKSSEVGGNIGWLNEKKLSKEIYDSIKNLKTNELSKPIYLKETILIIKKMGEKILEKNIEKIKTRIVQMEKEKKLEMFSNSHFSNLERTTQIDFL